MLPISAITRHSWSSYWLRNICHGLETHPVYTRSVAHAVFLSELLSRITQHRLDLDRAALAHCRCATPPIPNPTRKQAMAALADEFMEYLSGLIHDPPNPKDDTSDPQANHRILQLEQELAEARSQVKQHNIEPPTTPQRKRTAPPASPAPTPKSSTAAAPLPLLASQPQQPSPIPAPTPSPTPSPAPHASSAVSVTDSLIAASKKSKIQTQLPGAPAQPEKPDIFSPPPGPSQWFTQNFTGAYSDSRTKRWISTLRIQDKKKHQLQTHTEELLKQYPQLTSEQDEQLRKNAETWGLPPQRIKKLQTSHLIRILSVIAHLTE